MLLTFSQTLPAMQRQVLVLEEKYKDIAQLKTMKEQVEELKKERVWAEVIDAEKVQYIFFFMIVIKRPQCCSEANEIQISYF